MNYHFKQALDNLVYSKTPEGEAEKILRLTIQKLESQCINGDTEICFSIIHKEALHLYELYISYGKDVDNNPLKLHNITIDPTKYSFRNNKALDIALELFYVIESHLKTEGYNCKRNDPLLKLNGYRMIISFKFKSNAKNLQE